MEESVTRRFLFGRAGPEPRTPREPEGWLHLQGVSRHNLRDVDADFPLGVLTAVTGVSGSGKSTLVNEVLADGEEADEEELGHLRPRGARRPEADRPHAAIEPRHLHRACSTPSGRCSPTPTRPAAAATPPGRFSFNVAGGRCETCQGEGFVAVELLFLPGTYGPCPTCHGARYNPETLEVRYRGTSIADVLQMTVAQASGFLADVRGATRSLETLLDVGLGYLRLGQPATELSGGEAQRIKLATELQRGRRGHTLYLLDEPTTGLHPADVELLVIQLQRLVDAGNTVVVVEHDMDVVAGADWVIDLGPGAGAQGGRIVAAGTPGEVAACGGQPHGALSLRASGTGAGRRLAAKPRRPARSRGGWVRDTRGRERRVGRVRRQRGGLALVARRGEEGAPGDDRGQQRRRHGRSGSTSRSPTAVAASGGLVALSFEEWKGGTQTVGRIDVIAIQGVDQAPTFTVYCSPPGAGIARDASLAPDAAAIPWKDDGGVKVAGRPTGTTDPCVMGSAPVVLSPTGEYPSIGGADVAAFLPATPPAGPGPGGPGATPAR